MITLKCHENIPLTGATVSVPATFGTAGRAVKSKSGNLLFTVMVTSTNRVFIVVITCVGTCHAKFAAVVQVIVATRLFPLPAMGIYGVGVDTAPVEIRAGWALCRLAPLPFAGPGGGGAGSARGPS